MTLESQIIANYNHYYKNQDKIINKSIKYYYNHRDKILDYKKDFYYNKTYKFKLIKKIQLKGFSKRESNIHLKDKITNNLLFVKIISDDGEIEEMDYDTFLETYSLRDDIKMMFEKEYDDTGNKLFMFIPKILILKKVIENN